MVVVVLAVVLVVVIYIVRASDEWTRYGGVLVPCAGLVLYGAVVMMEVMIVVAKPWMQ